MAGVMAQLADGWRPAAYAALKALALFLTAAAAIRFTERRTIAEFSPFDWIAAVAAGAIVGRTATAAHTSWLTGTAALLTVIASHAIVARLRFIPWMRRRVDPPVRVLVRDGQVHQPNLKRSRITRADLDAVLREHGYLNPADVRLALYESNGTVSIFAKAQPCRSMPVEPDSADARQNRGPNRCKPPR